ncbi:helix-turn-helix domain-containing protein [Micromonospora sp. NPDC000207]|uniref:helix-turn-helix domain-containing protein n=1 Tax=Micromonospora sp. NPDC000207 TaxID=3154246 RepID=UPI003318FFC5
MSLYSNESGRGELPIGRRVAQWRVRRRLTQQVFADRLGKSKSWVDKVERGVRALDRYSVIEEIAEVLRVDAVVLLGRDAAMVSVSSIGSGLDGVERLHAALTSYEVFRTGAEPVPVPPAELDRHVGHAVLTYQHAHYALLVRTLPGLLDAARRLHRVDPARGAELLVRSYRIVSLSAVKLGEPELAWLAADRAVAVAGTDPGLAATAVVPLAQALRASGRDRLAWTATVAVACRSEIGGSVAGALLVQAGLAAAGCGDRRAVTELLDQAAATLVGGHGRRIDVGPVEVEVARVVAVAVLGDAGRRYTGTNRWSGGTGGGDYRPSTGARTCSTSRGHTSRSGTRWERGEC